MFISVLILTICALVAFSISAVCGGGAGLLLIPVLKTVLPGPQVPAALSIGTASSSLSRIVVFRADVNWKMVSRFVPAAIPGVCIGAWLLRHFNPLYLELLMGIFLVSNLTMIFRKDQVTSQY